MTPRKQKAKPWRYVAGERPHTVTVEEIAPGSVLYERAWSPARKRQVRRSLGHRDRDRARAHAEAAARSLRAGAAALDATAPMTVARVLALYLAHRTPAKGAEKTRREDRRRAGLWARLLGPRRVQTLGRAEWDTFIRQRQAGAIDQHGRPVPEGARTTRGPRTADGDLVFLVSVCNWALGWNRPDGSRLLDRNPWAAEAAGVTRSLARPKNPSPKRPVATYDRYLAVRAVADRVRVRVPKGTPGAELMTVAEKPHGRRRTLGPVRLWGRVTPLPEILDLVEQTGRRVGAVRTLTTDDLRWSGGEVTALRWRPWKGSEDAVLPVTPETAAALASALRKRAVIGAGPLFPAATKPGQPVGQKVLDSWLLEAERLAGLPKQDGGLWHPYRRKWATERKHLPDQDAARVAGWRDVETMKRSYQQTDDATVLAVITSTTKLRERKA